ncbi:MAG: hypothetical protein V7K32_25990 [Nostoc sp.]
MVRTFVLPNITEVLGNPALNPFESTFLNYNASGDIDLCLDAALNPFGSTFLNSTYVEVEF